MHAWINITHPGFSGRQDMPDDGDQWVSWEQMVATLRAKGEAEGRAALLAREVVELRGEVAKLKPLEMILAKGGDPVQHLSEAVLDLSAKVRGMEEASRLDQSEILRLTRCIAELQANLIAVVEPTAVVVPELTDDEIHARLIKLFPDVGEDAPEREWCFKDSRWAYNLAASRARAIPADRVLGIGMVAVDREEFEGATRWTFDGIDIHKVEHKKGFWFAVRCGNSCMSRVGKWDLEPLPSSRTPEFFAEFRFDTFRDALIALRANQGGAATC